MILIDTSVWIEGERKRAQALLRLTELIESGEAAVSAVTLHELPRLPAAWRRFYLQLFALVPVLELSTEAAEAAAGWWAARKRRSEGHRARAHRRHCGRRGPPCRHLRQRLSHLDADG